MRRPIVAILACAAFAGSAVPAAAQQSAVLSGRVFESASSAPIRGASVTVQGIGTALTDTTGVFHIQGVPHGRHQVVVHGLGYRPAEIAVTIAGDTVVTIALDIQPVLLDEVGATDRRITLNGLVRDEETGRPLFDARVLVTPDHETTTTVAGRFRVRRLFAGVPIVAEVRALRYLPHPVALQPDVDTTLTFDMRVDSVALRLIAAQEDRLEARTDASPYFPLTIDREDVLRLYNWTARDLVREAVGRRGITCLFIDEREITLDVEAQLDLILAPEVQRIEILRERPPPMTMVRVYTQRFFERTGLTTPLRPIRMISVPGRPFCT